MRKDSVNVVYNKKLESWKIHRGLNKVPSKTCSTKREAETFARQFCHKWDMPLTLYNTDGTLSVRNTSQRRAAAPTTKKPVRKVAKPKTANRKRPVKRR